MEQIKAPVFPESVQDGTIVNWHFGEGNYVTRDQVLAEIETDKVLLEVIAPDNGVMGKIIKNVGDTVLSAEIIAELDKGATADNSNNDNSSSDSSSSFQAIPFLRWYKHGHILLQ